MSDNNPRIPAPEHPYRHQLDVQLRFNDIDIFGHVNNSVYLQFFDLGKLRYFEEVLGKDFAKKGPALVIVNINCDFYSPAFLGDSLRVLTAVSHIGDKSIVLEQRVTGASMDDVKCLCRTTMAGFDPHTLKSAPIPDASRRDIEEYEGHKLG